mgnify:CR=1 FL=1|jgi:hypothetical protein
MTDYVDMIFEGHHKKTTEEQQQFLKAKAERIKRAAEDGKARQRMAANIAKHYKSKPFIEAL